MSTALAERFRVPHQSRSLPEYNDELHVDDGCEVAPKCLSCPLPACRYDRGDDRPAHPNGRQAIEREAAARAMWREGRTRHEIVAALGISMRTVYRYLGEVRP